VRLTDSRFQVANFDENVGIPGTFLKIIKIVYPNADNDLQLNQSIFFGAIIQL